MSTLQATNLKHNASASNNITLDSAGNVGVGVAAPSARLHISGASGSPQARLGTPAGYYEINAFDGNPVYMVVNGTNHTSGVIGTQSNTPFAFFTNNTERGRFTAGGDFQFNSGYGSVAVAFGCRAWVNFNGTGTVAIRASGNVSSITDNGVGDYTINFSTAMPDVNYAAVYGGRSAGIVNASYGGGVWGAEGGTYSTTALRVVYLAFGTVNYVGQVTDLPTACVAIFR
ncbi:hypothetical protein UFOVP345_47 [uncultured Caudovirales phage]|uniref:Uncharacterized protein n=1 Tax=uncultured Caudovirales phage TaxID=2100421 RepID=A0A6J5M1Q4_9CAUD|nr:hypothetical protein UFOVP345_47 [uncultured Caudovirales phage]